MPAADEVMTNVWNGVWHKPNFPANEFFIHNTKLTFLYESGTNAYKKNSSKKIKLLPVEVELITLTITGLKI